MKVPASEGRALPADKEGQHKQVAAEAEYVDDQTLIPKCAFVVICQFPRFPFKPIVLFQVTADEEEDSKTSVGEDKQLYGTDFDDFGEDVFEAPKVAPLRLGNPANPLSKSQVLANTAALDRPQTTGGGLAEQGYGRDRYEWLKPPASYVCHRCKIPGHFIQHCPTNGDPNFDIKRVITPIGIQKSMLTATTDVVHAKTNGSVMKPNVAVFEKEMEGMVSTCNVSDLPELNCPLCKQVMKDAALTSKCCFRSFCDKCIRDQFISKRTCVCGATDRLADELLPNKTLRETINRRIESKCNSSGSRDQGKEFAPLGSSKDKKSCVTQQEPLEITKAPDVPECNMKAPASEGRALPADKEGQHKQVAAEAEYVDDQTLIPKCAFVVICRFPRFPSKPIVLFQETADEEEDSKTSISEDKQLYGTDFDDFGEDVFEVPKAAPLRLANPANPLSKTQTLANTAALDHPQTTGGGLAGQGYGRDRYEWLKPPAGYVCHRCKIPGHFIQHCPTNGDPNFDIKRVIPPTGSPKSMLTATTDVVHAKTNGSVMKQNVDAFEMEMKGMVSTCNVSDLTELNCPLCKKVMKDAALTSKCCFRSFCDKCIRDQFISKRTCVCGATNRLADELLPNKTLRETINGRIEANCNSSGSRDQGKEFAPLVSSKDKKSCVTQQEPLEITKAPDVPESNMKAPTSEGRALPADKEGQHKQVAVKAANNKKRKKADSHISEIQGSTPPNIATQSYMTPGGSLAYNPHWNGMHPGMTAYMHPYYMAAYCNGQFGVPGMKPPQTGPHRDNGEPEMRMNDRAPTTSREESKACKSESRQKHGPKRGVQRESSKDQESRKEVRSSADVTSSKYQESRREVRSSAAVTSRKLKRVSSTPPRASSKRRSSSRRDEYDDRHRHHKRHRSER